MAPATQPLWGVSRAGKTVQVHSYHHLARLLDRGYAVTGGSRFAAAAADAIICDTIIAIEGYRPHQNPPSYSSKGAAV